jgi:hypothetical protein
VPLPSVTESTDTESTCHRIYRAKVVSGGDFRVFVRVGLAAKWLPVALKDVGHFKLKSSDDRQMMEKELLVAYKKAEDYLQRDK